MDLFIAQNYPKLYFQKRSLVIACPSALHEAETPNEVPTSTSYKIDVPIATITGMISGKLPVGVSKYRSNNIYNMFQFNKNNTIQALKQLPAT